MQDSELTPAGKRAMSLIEFDPDEQFICEIHKHPIGLLIVWLIGLFIGVSVLAVTIASMYLLTGDHFGLGADLSSARPIAAALGFIIVILVVGATALTAYVYRRNIILVTSDKVAEVTYVSIFNRKITQLDLGDIQDVAVAQKGIFSRVFGYGTMVIETAGEHENVTFTYAPYPYKCAKKIVGAREVRKSMSGAMPQAAYQAAMPQAVAPAAAPMPEAQPQPGPGQTTPPPVDPNQPPAPN